MRYGTDPGVWERSHRFRSAGLPLVIIGVFMGAGCLLCLYVSGLDEPPRYVRLSGAALQVAALLTGVISVGSLLRALDPSPDILVGPDGLAVRSFVKWSRYRWDEIVAVSGPVFTKATRPNGSEMHLLVRRVGLKTVFLPSGKEAQEVVDLVKSYGGVTDHTQRTTRELYDYLRERSGEDDSESDENEDRPWF